MHRFALSHLEEWKDRANRKPLVVRGARQVGKSYLVRQFGRARFANLVEIDFELRPEVARLFESRDPGKILPLLELQTNRSIIPGETLLFLDEIQRVPDVLASLRYFRELRPDLHVIAAGSLLDLALADPVHPMPVGRIEFLHLGPMTFEEFLIGIGHERLQGYLNETTVEEPIPQTIHQRLMDHLRAFLLVGGMPEAIQAFADTGSFIESTRVHRSLLATLQDDFAKYGDRVDAGRLRKVFRKLPVLIGRKFQYVQVDRGERSKDLAAALELLCRARICHRVHHVNGGGVPLGAEADDRRFKTLFLDVGLVTTACGLEPLPLQEAAELTLVNSGAVAEQHIGQHLLQAGPSHAEPELYYWAREKRSASAEVDYLQAVGTMVIPVEVKAGKTGTLKSLHLFLAEKDRRLGVRFNSDRPSFLRTEVSLSTGGSREIELLSLPLYLVSQLHRLVRAVL